MNLNDDHHISRPEDDTLGRSPFASQLARAFWNWRRNGSLVTALYGDWGSGKTSVKDLMIYHLHELAGKTGEEPTIVDFNPWMFSSAEQITRQFFEALAEKLPSEPEFQKEHAVSRLKLFGKALSLGSTITRVATRLASVSSDDPIAVTAVGNLMAEAADIGAKVAEAGAEVETKRVEAGGDLQHLKEEISGLLQKLRRPIVVVIDDIDRLAAEEIRLIMQLVKANANFPKVVYFLLFERRIVVNALDTFAAESGDRYLEKIVQVRLDMPRPDPEALQEAFFREIQSIVSGDQRIARRFSLERLEEVYMAGLAPYIYNLRRVFGLTNSLVFHAGVFLRADSFDVDFNDLILLEVLRLFEPPVYRAVSNSKRLLMSDEFFLDLDSDAEAQQKLEEKMKILIPPESRERQPQIVALLEQLFPQTKGQFGNFSLFNFVFGTEAIAALKIAHPMVFDRYFEFGVSDRTEPRRDIEELLHALDNRNKAGAVIHQLLNSRRLEVLLNWLWQHLPDLGADARENLALGFVDSWYHLSEPTAPTVTSSIQDTVMGYIMWLLLNAPEGNSGEALLGMLTTETNDLRFQALLLIKLSPRHGPNDEIGALAASDAHRNAVNRWLQCVRAAAADETLANEPALSYLLLVWERWAGKEEAHQWAEKLITSSEGILAIVIGCVSYTSTVNDEGRTVYKPFIDMERLQQILPIDRACEAIAHLALEVVEDDWRRQAFAVFKKICHKRSQTVT